MLVHIAPSWNAAAHKKCLSTGGEFVTQIWAILSHCNIQESNLWPQQESPNDNEAEQQEESVSGNQASFSAQQRAAAGHGGVRDDEAGPSGTKPNDETKDDDEKKMSVNLSSRTPIKRDSVS